MNCPNCKQKLEYRFQNRVWGYAYFRCHNEDLDLVFDLRTQRWIIGIVLNESIRREEDVVGRT
jgi:hypothetical protein